jgi:replicative DNA helicase
MDLDLSVIKAVLANKGAFSFAKTEGVQDVMFRGNGVRAWKFISEHVVEHGQVPSLDFFYAKTGIELPDVEDNISTLVTDFKKRALWSKTSAFHEKLKGVLEGNEIDDVIPCVHDFLNDVYRSNVAAKKIGNLLALGPEVMDLYRRIKSGERGILTPWDALNNMTLGFWPGDFVVFVARMGVGKCVDEETLIPDPDTGIYKRIKDVVGSRGRVFTRDRYGVIDGVIPSAHLHTGKKECLEVTTRSGYSVTVTPEHPFSVVGGWLKAEELRVGDAIESVKWMPEPRMSNDDMEEDDIMLAAALLAEGGLTTNPPKFSNIDQEILSIVRRAVHRHGCSLYKHKGMNESTWAIAIEDGQECVRGACNPIRDFIERIGIGYEKSIDKTIPDFVFSLSNRLLSKFLGMLWSCDGSVESKNRLSIGLGSKRMVYQIKRLLLRFGITGRIRKKIVRGKFFSWELLVHSSCIFNFQSLIELIGDKRERLKAMRGGTNRNVDAVPLNDWLREKLEDIFDGSDVKISDIGKRLGWKSWFSRRNVFQYDTISKRMIGAIADVYGRDDLLDLCIPYWDEVVSIEPMGTKEVYDLTVPGTHCFVADGLVVHNTFAMLMMARQAWMDGKKVLFVGTEMNRITLAMRFFALHFALPYQDFRHGQLGDLVEERLDESIRLISSETGINVVGDDFDAEINEIIMAVEQTRPDIVFVDGLYLVKNAGHDRHTRVSNTADDLKRMAKRLSIPVIASTQFNREVGANTKTAVTAANIGISDVIGWDADVAIGQYQLDDMKEDKVMGFRPLKVREGIGSDFFTEWDFDEMSFKQKATEEEVDKQYEDSYDEIPGESVADRDWGSGEGEELF